MNLLQWDRSSDTMGSGSAMSSYRLHVVQTYCSSQVGGLQACVDLSSLLKLDEFAGLPKGTRVNSTVSRARVDEKEKPELTGSLCEGPRIQGMLWDLLRCSI